MRRILTVIAFWLIAMGSVFAQAYVDPKLKAALAEANVAQVVVTFKGESAPNLLDVAALTNAGITKGLTLRALPIAGIVATAAQVDALSKNSRVLSLVLNASMKHENDNATSVTGAVKVRNEIAFTTKKWWFASKW